MDKTFQAVFESGVLRPLEPLGLNDREVLTLVVAERSGLSAVDDDWEDIIDHEALLTAELESEGEISLEELRERLSTIRGSMSDVVISERGDY